MYVELHARSAFSFLEGASVPEELVAMCAAYEMSTLALLDRDGVYGSPRCHLAAKKNGHVRAHVGAEVASVAGWRYPLLVESRVGYRNLCRLITQMKLRAKKGEGSVTREEVAEQSAGLICLTGGDEGPLAFALAQGGLKVAVEAAGCARYLAETMSMSNCSGISRVRKRPATRPPSKSRRF